MRPLVLSSILLSAAFVVGCGVDTIQAPSPSARPALLERAETGSGMAFSFKTIDVPGAASTSASGINARGDIVGSYVDGTGSHGYLLRDGEFTTIDFTSSDGTLAAGTEAKGISPDGEVVGDYWMPGESSPVKVHGYRRTVQGEFVAVNYPGHTHAIIQRILPDGTMLGCRHDDDLMDTMKGITMSRAGNTEISQFSSMENGATPDRRRIVGLYKNDAASPQRGFVIADGVFTPLFLDATTPALAAWDVNLAGKIVGVYSKAGVHGFVLSGDGYATLDFPGAAQTRAFGINARGDVVGSYLGTDGKTHGFQASQTGED